MPKYRESFDIVVSRAVASMNVLLEYCIPFLKVDGKCVMYKGVNYQEELSQCDNALKKLNCKILSIEKSFVDELNTERVFVIIEKIDHTPKQYPRVQNKARKQPL